MNEERKESESSEKKEGYRGGSSKCVKEGGGVGWGVWVRKGHEQGKDGALRRPLAL